MSRFKKIILSLAIITLILLAIFLLGPRIPVDTTINPITLPNTPAELSAYVAAREAAFTDIVPNTEATIIWADPANPAPTEYVVLYMHGFSATRQEAAPLSDNVAQALGANLFYPRLTGHGRTGPAMTTASVNAWLNDTYEAYQIATKLGQKVVIIATSTGATLTTWLANQPENDQLHALILISPNYGPRNPQAEILLLPWGQQIGRLVGGPERAWEGYTPEHELYWTNRYPIEGVFPMIALVNLIRNTNLDQITTPTLAIYSPDDQVVSPTAIEDTLQRFTAATVTTSDFPHKNYPDNHVNVGDILGPNNTAPITQQITAFVRQQED
ncbi:MAG TPA: alpha/beta hydrolase [Anaerolineae bacterium]|nr:alpha/beta hydrolase [Anaerolineae bacterium]